jgi:peptidyl-prolyl cis-trans isomerase C
MQTGYLELKLSWALFEKAPEALADPERKRLIEVAKKQSRIEQSILASTEAANVIVPAATLKSRLAEISQRYPSAAEFEQDMARTGLRQDELENSVERDLRVESVLEKIASRAEPVTVVDAEIYYRLHPEAFDRPEARRLRHIMITYSSAGEKAKVAALLESLRSTHKTAEKFAKAALRHSQCPTAMDGGKLGLVKRQQLYAELEPAAFSLAPGEISAVCESPIGLHILRCDEILPSGLLRFEDIQTKVIDRLTEKRRSETQRDWVKTLLSVQHFSTE